MRRHFTSFGACGLIFIAAPGTAFADCAESVALLAKDVRLIAAAGPLAADPNAPLGPGDTIVTLENPALTSRTSKAFDMFKSPPAESGEKPEWGFSANLARARESLDLARAAENRGDTAACEGAVSVGLDAARRARGWFR